MSVPQEDVLAKAILMTIGRVLGKKITGEQYSYTMVELEQVVYALLVTATKDEVAAIGAARMFGEHIVQRIMLSEERT